MSEAEAIERAIRRDPAAVEANGGPGVKKGDSVSSILRDQGATPDEIRAIVATLGARGRDGGVKEGEKLRILMGPAGPVPDARLQPYRVIVIASDRSRTTYTIQLEGVPLIGGSLELPHGEIVTVHSVTSGAPYGLAGVIIAGPPVE